jgi:hypothetical protein
MRPVRIEAPAIDQDKRSYRLAGDARGTLRGSLNIKHFAGDYADRRIELRRPNNLPVRVERH